jgi:hypothetical protein
VKGDLFGKLFYKRKNELAKIVKIVEIKMKAFFRARQKIENQNNRAFFRARRR